MEQNLQFQILVEESQNTIQHLYKFVFLLWKKKPKNFNNAIKKSSFMSFHVKKECKIFWRNFSEIFPQIFRTWVTENSTFPSNVFKQSKKIVNVKNKTFQNLTIISQKMAWPSTDIIYELRHISKRLKKPLELKFCRKRLALPYQSPHEPAGQGVIFCRPLRFGLVSFFPSNCSRRNDVVVSLFVLAHSAVDGVSHGNLTFCKKQKNPNFRGWNGSFRRVSPKPH